MKYLTIPFVIKAYAANDTYADTYKPPRWSPDYTKVYSSALGASITPPAFTEYENCLKAGVHLHFILPDAFRHGTVTETENESKYDFPAVPNRYIVTRLYSDNGKINVKCFVVESDFLKTNLDPDENSEDYTVIYVDRSSPPYRFMGRRYEAGTVPAEGEHLERLTALGGGDPMFSAYYPSCRSVFGFYDDMTGVPDNCSLTYFVLGYFYDTEDDLFSGVKSAEDFAALLSANNFTVDPGSSGDFCDRCVLFGEAVNIEWKGKKYTYSDMNPPTGNIDISFGATSAEAMSAILAQKILKDQISCDDPEYQLTQLQYDLLKQQAQTDGNFMIDDEIHMRTFSELDPLEKYDELKLKEGCVSDQLPDLTDYHELRRLQREEGRKNREISFTQKKLYYTWETYIQRCESQAPDESEALDEIRALIDEINKLIAEGKDLEDQITIMRNSVGESLPPEYELVTETAAPFVIPKEPVLMVSGDGIIHSFAYEEKDNDDTVYCQITLQNSPEVSIEKILDICDGMTPEFLPFNYQPYLYQAILNSAELMEPFGAYTVTGDISSLAVNTSPLELLQLFMDWQVDYYYTDRDASLGDWSFEYGQTNYTYNGDEKNVYKSVSGRIPLTPHALYTLVDQLNKYQAEFPKVYDKLHDLPFISQELSGFTNELAGLRQVFQLPITYDMHDISKEVANYADEQRLSVCGSELFPLRGGYIALSKLNVIGNFGQKQIVVKDSAYNNSKAYFPNYMRVSEKGTKGLFPLAFTSEARLTAEFVAAGLTDKAVFESGAGNGGSPICAMILPELLNNRLILYNEKGEYAGMLKTVFRSDASRNIYIAPPNITTLNPVLKGFIDGIMQNDSSLPALMSLIQDTLDETIHTCESDFIWGVPLTLSRLRVRFEFFGGAEYSKKRENFGKYYDKGIGDLKLPLKFGNIARVMDGTVGVYEADDFSALHAFWGVGERLCNGYVTAESPCISANDGDKIFTVLSAPDSDLYIETGLLPVVNTYIDSMYTSLMEKIIPTAEINPIIADTEKIRLPIADEFRWMYKTSIQSDNITDIFPLEDIITENSVMDGFLVKKK